MDRNLVNFADDDADSVEQVRGRERFGEAVLYGTDWTVGSLLQQIDVGNIDLAPDFQRRDAWSIKNKCRFIESIALQLPIPQIVLAERKGEKGSYIVLDGKQRLLTLAQFSGAFASEHQVASQFRFPAPMRLSGLQILKELNGCTYLDLETNPELYGIKKQFDNHTIRSALIRNWPDEDYLYEVFIRLNTGSTKLSPQELRQAMKPGRFTEFLARRSSESEVIQKILGIHAPDFRMRDVDLLLRMIAFSSRLEVYRGEMKVFLDETHDHYNREWESLQPYVLQLVSTIETALEFLIEKFHGPKNVGRRWRGKKYEGAVNRAVLDVQLGLALNAQNRVLLEGADMEAAFKDLCVSDSRFIEAVSSTTKSISAVVNRYTGWRDAVQRSTDVHLQLPALPASSHG